MKTGLSDLSLFFKNNNRRLLGIPARYVDDTISAGNESHEREGDSTKNKFETKPRRYDHFKFAGMEILTPPDDCGFKIDLSDFAKRIT